MPGLCVMVTSAAAAFAAIIVTLSPLMAVKITSVLLQSPQDAAKKALQEMFSGKDDLLAAYDGPPGGGNSGGRGGGGGGGWFGGFNFNEFGDNFMRSMKGLLSFLGAVALIGGLVRNPPSKPCACCLTLCPSCSRLPNPPNPLWPELLGPIVDLLTQPFPTVSTVLRAEILAGCICSYGHGAHENLQVHTRASPCCHLHYQ